MRLTREFKKWLKARYPLKLNKAKDLCDKIRNKIKIIEDLINNDL